jgi:hypothetical protein
MSAINAMVDTGRLFPVPGVGNPTAPWFPRSHGRYHVGDRSRHGLEHRRATIDEQPETAYLIGVLVFRRASIEECDDGPSRKAMLAAIDGLISDLEAGDVPRQLL